MIYMLNRHTPVKHLMGLEYKTTCNQLLKQPHCRYSNSSIVLRSSIRNYTFPK